MSLTTDINSLVRPKKVKQPIPVLSSQSARASIKAASTTDEKGFSGGPVSPLEFVALTYDDTQDVEFEDTSAATHTLKTVATAKIVDAEGNEWAIDTVTFTTPE